MTYDELRPFEGKTIIRIRRAFYEHRGKVDRATGLLEITFDDHLVVVFDDASDGQSLTVGHGEWVDPFEGPQSPENEEFIATSGKWTAFDVSAEEPFDQLVGSTVVRVGAVLDVFGVVSGVFFETRDVALVGENRFDDFYCSVIDLV